VGAAVAVDEVVARAAEQQVVAVAAEQRVVAAAAVDREVRRARDAVLAGDLVVAAEGLDERLLGAAAGGAVDAGVGRGADAGGSDAGGRSDEDPGVVAVGAQVLGGVGALA